MARRTPGNYVPLDVNYVRDSAIRRAGEAAELLFVRSLAYCKGSRSRGFIPDYDLEVVAVGMKNVAKRVDSLVAQTLWVVVDGGWRVRSWDRWNNEGDGLERASAKGNHQRWHVNEHKIDPLCEWCGESPSESDGESPGESRREIPREGKGREGKETLVPRKRGTRIDPNYRPNADLIAWARRECPGIDVRAVTEQFVDYWTAATGQKATKLDWDATWRMWVRNDKRFNGANREQSAPGFWEAS